LIQAHRHRLVQLLPPAKQEHRQSPQILKMVEGRVLLQKEAFRRPDRQQVDQQQVDQQQVDQQQVDRPLGSRQLAQERLHLQRCQRLALIKFQKISLWFVCGSCYIPLRANSKVF
jgi:hypothetical protein